MLRYRTALRTKIAANRLASPLFDTRRFTTRDFETAVELMVQRHWDGLAPAHIDVPDGGPVEPGSIAPKLHRARGGAAICIRGLPVVRWAERFTRIQQQFVDPSLARAASALD